MKPAIQDDFPKAKSLKNMTSSKPLPMQHRKGLLRPQEEGPHAHLIISFYLVRDVRRGPRIIGETYPTNRDHILLFDKYSHSGYHVKYNSRRC